MRHIGEFEDCSASLAGVGFKGQLTADRLRKQVRQESPQSHTLSRSFGGEERFGDAFYDFPGHSYSFIANQKTDTSIVGSPRAQHNRLAIGARVQRILYKSSQCFDRGANRDDEIR